MKSYLFALFCALGILSAPQVTVADQTVVPNEPAPQEQTPHLSAEQIDELLAPIALYPDPLIAIILPASTYPTDIVLASRFIQNGGKADDIEQQPWDDSVKALARYPEVLRWMDENLSWTRQLGNTFLAQPADILTGAQRLRAAARAAGNLHDTAEQTVVVEKETIRIIPAQPDLIYVPVYNPLYVYRPRTIDFYYSGPVVRFSHGYRAGFWLSYYCDWGFRTIVVVDRPQRVVVWQGAPRWVPPRPTAPYYRPWRPSPARHQVAIRDPQRPQHPRPQHERMLPRQSVTTQPAAPSAPPATVDNRRPDPAHMTQRPSRPAVAPERNREAPRNRENPAARLDRPTTSAPTGSFPGGSRRIQESSTDRPALSNPAVVPDSRPATQAPRIIERPQTPSQSIRRERRIEQAAPASQRPVTQNRLVEPRSEMRQRAAAEQSASTSAGGENDGANRRQRQR